MPDFKLKRYSIRGRKDGQEDFADGHTHTLPFTGPRELA